MGVASAKTESVFASLATTAKAVRRGRARRSAKTCATDAAHATRTASACVTQAGVRRTAHLSCAQQTALTPKACASTMLPASVLLATMAVTARMTMPARTTAFTLPDTGSAKRGLAIAKVTGQVTTATLSSVTMTALATASATTALVCVKKAGAGLSPPTAQRSHAPTTAVAMACATTACVRASVNHGGSLSPIALELPAARTAAARDIAMMASANATRAGRALLAVLNLAPAKMADAVGAANATQKANATATKMRSALPVPASNAPRTAADVAHATVKSVHASATRAPVGRIAAWTCAIHLAPRAKGCANVQWTVPLCASVSQLSTARTAARPTAPTIVAASTVAALRQTHGAKLASA